MPEGGQDLGARREKKQRKGQNEVGLRRYRAAKAVLLLVDIRYRRQYGDLWSVTVLSHIMPFFYPM